MSERPAGIGPIRVRGIGRVADNPRAVLLMFSDRPTDDELRSLHDYLCDRVAIPTADDLRRCTICGLTVDVSFKAEKPSIDFSTAGRAKRRAE